MALVMFDYDGVIVDSLNNFIENFSAACRAHGYMASAQELIDFFDDNFYVSMLKKGIEETTINTILKNYKKIQEPSLIDLQLFPGISEMLEKLAQSHQLFIITSNLSSATEAVLEKYNIHCVKGVIGAEKEKSKVKKIQHVRMLYPNSPAFYVGDTKGDMLEGREAGASPIAVTWGWHSEERLRQGKPEHVAHSPQELVRILTTYSSSPAASKAVLSSTGNV